MTAIKHAKGVLLLVKVGDGTSPENFAAYCSINAQRGISFASAVNEFAMPDCADPEAIAWVAREKASLSVTVDGAGMLNTSDVAAFFTWWKSDDSKNCQVIVDVPAADGGVIFEGPFHLVDFKITGDRGGKQEVTLSLASDGEVTSTANT